MSKKKKISHSQYSTWANCPWGWKLKYVDGHRIFDQSIHTVFGTVMHEVIQDWINILYKKSVTVAKTTYLDDTFKEKFLSMFKSNIVLSENGEKTFLCDKDTLKEFYEQGCQILSYLQNNCEKIFPTQDVKLFGIEYELNIELRPNVTYTGYIDIVTYNEVTDEYILYDLKTSKSGWNDYQKKDDVKTGQLLLYKRFFAKQLGIDVNKVSVQYLILKRIIFEQTLYPSPRVSKFVPANKAPSLKKNWAAFERFINSAFDEDGEYIPDQKATPSNNACMWCEFKSKTDLCKFGV